MNGVALVFGLILLGGGLAGIFLVTIPSIYGIAEGAGETAEGAVDLSKNKEDGTTKVVSGVGKAVVSGLYSGSLLVYL